MWQWLGRHAVAAVIVASFVAYLMHELSASVFAYTGDAYVAADTIVIAPRVEGPIARLAVSDNQPVAAGDLLFEIDPKPYALALDEEKARLRQAEADLAKSRDEVDQASAEIAQRQATYTDASATEGRLRALYKDEDVPEQRLDDAVRDARVAQALLTLAQRKLATAQQTVTVGEAQVAVSKAAVARAAYSLEETRIFAPASGRVAPFDARIGDYRKAGDPVLAIVTDTGWRVVANVTERHLPRLLPGQVAWVMLGSAPWTVVRGEVTSVAAGISRTPGQSKVLPYVDPTTDWIHLPRRFPVEIHVPDRKALYLGTNAWVVVWF